MPAAGRLALGLAVAGVVATGPGCGSDRDPQRTSPGPPRPVTTERPDHPPNTLGRVRAVLERSRASLMRRPGVVGTGIGKAGDRPDPAGDDTDYEIHVFLRSSEARRGLPSAIEGVPVRPVVTGPIVAQ